jgi:hypothetical protein
MPLPLLSFVFLLRDLRVRSSSVFPCLSRDTSVARESHSTVTDFARFLG